jgi:hypothetical protein
MFGQRCEGKSFSVEDIKTAIITETKANKRLRLSFYVRTAYRRPQILMRPLAAIT